MNAFNSFLLLFSSLFFSLQLLISPSEKGRSKSVNTTQPLNPKFLRLHSRTYFIPVSILSFAPLLPVLRLLFLLPSVCPVLP